MKRLQIGQGLVEYNLILVLVAIVVQVILAILGPTIATFFCEIFAAMSLAPDVCFQFLP